MNTDQSPRTYWRATLASDRDAPGGMVEIDYEMSNDRKQVKSYQANLVSSLLENGRHKPAIDIDIACKLRASRTKDHYHLYIEKEMPWWKYRMLLKVMVWCGIVEEGYYRASVGRKQTHLRYSP